MSSPTKDERIAFWKHAYARSSFIQAYLFTKLLLDAGPPYRAPLRDALTYAIVTAYGRPFKQRQEIRLPKDEVPSEYRQLHDEAIEMRDKVIAHRDLDGPVTDWGFVSQVTFAVDDKGFEINTLSPNIENERALAMLPLFEALIAQMDEKLQPFVQKNMRPPLPAPGNYVVSLDADPEVWLQKI
jgi:hypothetical protein